MPTSERKQNIEKLYEMIFNIHQGMLVTHTQSGSLRSRPMGIHLCRSDDCLWLFTDEETVKVLEIRDDNEVNISFSQPSEMNFVSVTGVATLVRDQKKIEEVWSPIAKSSHPKGKDDPNLILIRIEPTFAEFWDVATDAFSQMFEATKAMLTGEPKKRPGEHAKVKQFP